MLFINSLGGIMSSLKLQKSKQFKVVKVKNLSFLPDNPRFSQRFETNEEVFNYIISTEKKRLGEKTYKLAKDICEKGLNTPDVPTILSRDGGRYFVYEGNRRLAAITALRKPKLINDETIRKRYQKLKNLCPYDLSSLHCYVASDLIEANNIMKLKHGNNLNGLGTEKWDAIENKREQARSSGKVDPDVYLYDYIQKNNLFDGDIEDEILISVFERATPIFFEKLLLNKTDTTLQTKVKIERFNEILKNVLVFLKEENTRTLNNDKDRIRFKQSVQHLWPSVGDIEPHYIDLKINSVDDWKDDLDDALDVKPPVYKKVLPKVTVNNAPPKGLNLHIESQTIKGIYDSLVKMQNAKSHQNAFAVLSRVFLELSIDYWGENNIPGYYNYCKDGFTQSEDGNVKLMHNELKGIEKLDLTKEQLKAIQFLKKKVPSLKKEKATLARKKRYIVDAMKEKKLLSDNQVKAIKEGMRAFPIEKFNSAVHNYHLTLDKKELLDSWSNLKPLYEAIHSRK